MASGELYINNYDLFLIENTFFLPCSGLIDRGGQPIKQFDGDMFNENGTVEQTVLGYTSRTFLCCDVGQKPIIHCLAWAKSSHVFPENQKIHTTSTQAQSLGSPVNNMSIPCTKTN